MWAGSKGRVKPDVLPEGSTRNVESYLQTQSRPFWLGLGMVLVAMFGLLNFLAGPLSFTILYFVPIFLVTWFAGQRFGVIVFLTTICLTIWVGTSSSTGDSGLLRYGRVAIEVGSLLVVTLLVVLLKKFVDAQKQTARIDEITGTANERYFTELANNEILRSKRSSNPLTVAYVELALSKRKADIFGEGIDKGVLASLAKALQSSVRTTDTIARVQMRGFALLLPETGSQSAKVVLEKIKEKASEVFENHEAPSVKVGAVTFCTAPDSVDEMLLTTNSLIHAVKTSRRGFVTHEVGKNQLHKK